MCEGWGAVVIGSLLVAFILGFLSIHYRQQADMYRAQRDDVIEAHARETYVPTNPEGDD